MYVQLNLQYQVYKLKFNLVNKLLVIITMQYRGLMNYETN